MKLFASAGDFAITYQYSQTAIESFPVRVVLQLGHLTSSDSERTVSAKLCRSYDAGTFDAPDRSLTVSDWRADRVSTYNSHFGGEDEIDSRQIVLKLYNTRGALTRGGILQKYARELKQKPLGRMFSI